VKVVEAVNCVYKTSFPVPDFCSRSLCCRDAFREAKKFFSGLLDGLNGTGTHQWLALVIGLPVQERLRIASSLCSGKKLLPDPCPGLVKKMEEAHASLLTEPKLVPTGFLAFVRKSVLRMFPDGWDRGYSDCVESATLPLSAAVGLPRSKGGVSACGMSRELYTRACYGLDEVTFPRDVNYCMVVTEGKARGITITHKEHQFLKPLHMVLYNFLSKKSWMLRGDATADRLSEFSGGGDGSLLISGDYESATDGLSLEVSELILSTLLESATHVPEKVKGWAQSSLRSRIHYPGGKIVEQLRGQLMGNLLSFPLLCLYNFLALKYLVRRRVAVKINGDDIVFRGTRDEYERWRDGLGELGLKLSAGKTFLHGRFFSINSTYFWSSQSKVKMMGVLRLGMLKAPEGVDNLGASHNKFVKPMGNLRSLSSALFLRVQRRYLKLSGRSLLTPAPMGLGVRTCVAALDGAGLTERECWYLRNFSPRKGMPKTPAPHNLSGVPEGWRRFEGRKPRGWKLLEGELAEEMLERRWATSVKMVEEDRWGPYWDHLKTFGGEGFWRVYVAERRTWKYSLGLALLKKAGYGKTHHPMKLSISSVYKAIKAIPRGSQGGRWWGRKREEIRFVSARCI
jgi:hypothetical protein